MSKYGGKKLTGKHPLAYMGVEPTTPGQMVNFSRAPTAADYKGYNIGTIWFNTNAATKIASEIWLLIGLSPLATATWTRIYPTAGTGTVLDVTANLPLTITGTPAVNPVVNLVNGADGTVLISDSVTGYPTWHTVTAGIHGISVASAAGSITIDSLANFICSGGGTATPDALGVINLAGAGGATVVATGPNTVTITAGGGGGGSVTSVNNGANINITSLTDPAIDPVVNLNTSIQQPVTNAAGTQGVYALGNSVLTGGYTTDRFMHNYGTSNTFLGYQAGNLTLTASKSVGLGTNSLQSLTSGCNNIGLGNDSLKSVTSGTGSIGIGDSSLETCNGNYNLAIGDLAGLNYTGVESSNILLQHIGVLGESNTIRIGTPGTGAGQQDKAYVAGIYQKTMGATKEIAFIDSNHKLGSVAVLPITYGGTNATSMAVSYGINYYDGTRIVTMASVGTAGQFLTSQGAGLPPTWGAGGGGSGTVTGVTGTLPIEVTTPTPNPVVSLRQGNNGQVLIAKTGAASIWANITPGVGITVSNAANAIEIINKVKYQTDDGAGSLVAPDGTTGVVKILGGAAIKTHYTAADTITIDDTLDINLQAASYVLVITDAGKFVQINNGAANTVTIPLNASVPFVVGTQIVVQQYGAGQTSIVAAGGVTIRSAGGRLKLAEQYSMAALVKTGLNEWQLGGDITL